jgi:hypothetical protein
VVIGNEGRRGYRVDDRKSAGEYRDGIGFGEA